MGGLEEWVDRDGFMTSPLCRSYEAKSLKMKKGKFLRDLFLGFQNLLCNYEAILRKRSPILCVATQGNVLLWVVG